MIPILILAISLPALAKWPVTVYQKIGADWDQGVRVL